MVSKKPPMILRSLPDDPEEMPAHGEPHRKFTTLTQAFRQRASLSRAVQEKDFPIIYLENGVETRETFADVLHDALEYIGVFQAIGLKKGDYVVLQILSRRKHFRVFWACALGGIIPVTVAVPSNFSVNSNLVEKIRGVLYTLKKVRPCAVLTEDAVVEQLMKAFSEDATIIHSVDKIRSVYRGATFKDVQADPKDVFFLQLTSGSTGIPKCIQETHAGIITQIVSSAEVCGYDYGNVSLNWLPFDHVVPMLTTHLRDVYIGMGQVQIPTEEVLSEPLLWIDSLEKYQVNFSWSPNFGFSLVNQACEAHRTQLGKTKQWDLSSIKYLMNAGEQVTSAVCNLFITNTGIPAAVIQPAFGMAETCTCITYCSDYSSERIFRATPESTTSFLVEAEPDEPAVEFVDLGPPVRSVEIRIAAMGQRSVPAPENVIGHFQIRGDVVTPGYVNRPEANLDAFVGDGWFDSGDLGFICRGRLYLTGRFKESINIRGANLYCYEIERQIESVQGVLPTFVAATSLLNNKIGTEELLIFFSPDGKHIDTKSLNEGEVRDKMQDLILAVRQKVTHSTGISPRVCVPVHPSEFHKTTSGKVQRNKFRDLYRDGHYDKLLSTFYKSPPLLQTGCFEHFWTPTELDINHRTLKIQIVDTVHGSAHSRAVTMALKDASCEIVQLNADHILFLAALAPAATDSVEAVAQTIQVLSLAAETLRSTHPESRFWAVTSSVMNHPVSESLHGFMRTLAMEEPGRRPTILTWDTSALSLPRILDVLKASNLHTEREVNISPECVSLASIKPAYIQLAGSLQLSSSATYFITGGCGALGLELCHFLIQSGARNLAILSRSFERASATRSLAPLRAKGAKIVVFIGDVSVKAEVVRVIDQFSQAQWPELKGVFHLAGLYEQEKASICTAESLERTLAAKACGAAILHEATIEYSLDHFVLFSSVSSIIGPIGHAAYAAAYAAANSFLDGLARMRREMDLAALSVRWGPWDHSGGMAGNNEFLFFDKIPMSEGFTCLGLMMQANVRSGMILNKFNFASYKTSAAEDADFKIPHLLVQQVEAVSVDENSIVLQSNTSAISSTLNNLIQDIIGISPPLDDPLLALGMDSADAMRLVVSLSKKLGKRVPLTFVFKYPTLRSMIDYFSGEISSEQKNLAKSVRVYQNEPQMEFKTWTGSLAELRKPLYLLGSGGHARTVIATLQALRVAISGIYTNLERDIGNKVMGVDVVGLLKDVPAAEDCLLHVCLGQPLLKREWVARFPDHSYVTIVHPTAVVDDSSTFGQGSFVGALAAIDGSVTIGAHTIIEVHALVAHDAVVGSFTLIGGMSAVAGASRIGDGVVMGVHSSMAPKVRLGNRAVLGSGSSAHVDIPEGCTAVGVPAEVLYEDVPIKM